MSIADFDLWYNIDPETASEVTRKHVCFDTDLPGHSTVRWSTGTMFQGRSIEYDVEDFNAWCKENLPYKWQGLFAKAEEKKLIETLREDLRYGVGGG